MEDFLEVSGLLYKRRGGFGKMMPHAWQQRYFFCSKDGYLYYYDTEGPEAIKTLNDSIAKDVDSFKSRGKIDLKTSHIDFTSEPSSDNSGAPTQFIILIVPSNGEEKWKLCASNSDDFSKWTKAFELFALRDEKISNIKNLAKSSNLSNDAIGSDLKLPPTSTSSRNDKGNTRIRGEKLKLGSNSSSSYDFVELCLTVAIMNICYYYVMINNKSQIHQVIYCAIANVVVIKTLLQRNQRKSSSNNESKSSSGSDESLNYSSNIKNDDPPVEEIIVKHPAPGTTYNEVFTSPNTSQAHTWCKCDHKMFNVRIGPDYNRYKKKAPSSVPLFEPFAVDVFWYGFKLFLLYISSVLTCIKCIIISHYFHSTNRRVDHASRFFSIPNELLEMDTNHPHVPPVYVVQIQIPSDPPASMFTTVEDGPGWAILMYFKITEVGRCVCAGISTHKFIDVNIYSHFSSLRLLRRILSIN